LTKVGFAKLTLAGPNTYTGTTTVSEGVLSLSSAYLADASALVIGIDGKLDLNFPGRDRVASLTIDGTTLPDGVYNSSDPDYGSFFSGSGSIQIGDVADGYQDWVTDYGLQNPWLGVDPALNGTPAADPDNDGSPNSLEYALGGSPVSGSDGPRIYPIVKDSDIDGDALPEQLLTIAVRSDTPAFSAGPQPSATVGDYTYTIQGSTDLATFTTAVQPVPTAVLPDAPAPAGYEYRTFSLTGSNGTPARGFMRVKVGH
jgi:autotransporter-associated beta strand protein